MFEVTVTKQIEDERLKDLLTGAFEGGSNYWFQIKEYVNPEQLKMDYRHIELPFIDGCGVMVGDIEDEEVQPVLLNRAAMEKGLKVMGEKYGWHLQAFLNEQDDASTSDVFLQCSLFGEIVYG